MSGVVVRYVSFWTSLFFLVDLLFFFFFSSRRRHTRCSRDWSSDVCSSDLTIDGDRQEEGRCPAKRAPPDFPLNNLSCEGSYTWTLLFSAGRKAVSPSRCL